jgi:DNA-binding NarL/FixJ family response regulator
MDMDFQRRAIRILTVDDHPMFHEGVASLIEDEAVGHCHRHCG